MIDLDRLEQRLDLALEEELRRHIGLDQPAPGPAPEPPEAPAAAWPPQPPPPSRSAALPPAPPRPRVVPTPPRSAPPPLRIRDRTRIRPPLAPGRDRAAATAGPDVEASSPEERLGFHAGQVVTLVSRGRIGDADHHIAAHAALAEELGDALARRDAAAWRAMRALLDGRQDQARTAISRTLSLGEAAADPDAWAVHAWPRFWFLLEWGPEQEQEGLLDFCRQRAYWHNELPWRGALTLLLARMGYAEEAARQFDVVLGNGLNGRTNDEAWLDIMTNVGEAAAILADVARCRAAYGALGRSSARSVVVGRAWVCKGSTSRVLGLLAAALGRSAECDRHFGAAMAGHRDMDAPSLLARTCVEWGVALAGRDQEAAEEYLDEGLGLATRLGMSGLAATARAGLDSLRQPVAS